MINLKKNWESESVLVLNVLSKKCFRKTFMRLVSTSFFLNLISSSNINFNWDPYKFGYNPVCYVK